MLSFVIPILLLKEARTRWFECQKLGSEYPHGQHGSKIQDGLVQNDGTTEQRRNNGKLPEQSKHRGTAEHYDRALAE